MAKQKPSPGHGWARRNLLPTPGARGAWAFQDKLEQSPWLAPEQLHQMQMHHLQALLRHAKTHVPGYRDVLAGFDTDTPINIDRFRELPILSREALQSADGAYTADVIPQAHGKTMTVSSSGSTSRPVTVTHSAISTNWHRALTLRSQLWAINRFDRKLGAIRRYRDGVADYPDGANGRRWADELTLPFTTGQAATLTIATPLHQQVAWLKREAPQVLVTYPSNLDGLCTHALENDLSLPQMKQILTLGEAMPEGLRRRAREVFGARISDTYSAAETSEIAIQCPDTIAHHIQSEAVLVEILDDSGKPCGPGETGRVIVTPLHNLATPLIRYEIGDMATVGKPCRCGRGLPVLDAVMGRFRNMMVAPDGSRFWPSFGVKSYSRVAPVSQAKFIQHEDGTLEAVLVSERDLEADEEEAIRAIILERLPVVVPVRFTYAEQIDRAANGKFEEFISRAV